MAATKKSIIDYIMKTPNNTNPNILTGMLDDIASEGPDLSGITATESEILVGYQGISAAGEDVIGACEFNAKIPDVSGAVYAAAEDIAKDKQALILIDGVWTLVTGTKE